MSKSDRSVEQVLLEKLLAQLGRLPAFAEELEKERARGATGLDAAQLSLDLEHARQGLVLLAGKLEHARQELALLATYVDQTGLTRQTQVETSRSDYEHVRRALEVAAESQKLFEMCDLDRLDRSKLSVITSYANELQTVSSFHLGAIRLRMAMAVLLKQEAQQLDKATLEQMADEAQRDVDSGLSWLSNWPSWLVFCTAAAMLDGRGD